MPSRAIEASNWEDNSPISIRGGSKGEEVARVTDPPEIASSESISTQP
jgi:hypothetical protein